jgi:hypothetical protein
VRVDLVRADLVRAHVDHRRGYRGVDLAHVDTERELRDAVAFRALSSSVASVSLLVPLALLTVLPACGVSSSALHLRRVEPASLTAVELRWVRLSQAT